MKYREFWIVPEDNVDFGRCYSTNFEGTIHVIEKKAYDNAIKMLEEMAWALQQKACCCDNNWQTGPNICIRCKTLDNYRKWKAGMK